MTFPFAGPQAKLDRANRKLVELESAEREFFQTNPIRVRIEVEPRSGHKLAKLFLDADPPEIFHLIAGELIYQIRSTLDQIAVALARISAARPNPKNVHFPSGESAVGFKASCTSNLAGFDPDFVDHIENLKVYDGGNDDLRSVFRIANVDKHMEVIAVGAAGNVSHISNFLIKDGETGLILGGTGNLKEGVLFSDLGLHGTITPINSNAQLRASGNIVIGNVPPFEGKPLVAFLRRLVEETSRTYNGIEQLCARTGRL